MGPGIRLRLGRLRGVVGARLRAPPDPLDAARARRDGREIDDRLGVLAGEGSLQQVKRPDAGGDDAGRAEERAARAALEGPSYHGLPVLKEPVWSWEIPTYFFTGGLAGASAVLGAAACAAGGPRTAELVRRARLVAVGSAVVSAVLLVDDLGRPARFLAMFRVFRPTSPMSMGSWLLGAFSVLAGVAALPSLLPPARGLPLVDPAARLAGYGAGVLGLPLVGYTGVLLANTAVPIWQETRNTLPVLFAFSGAVSGGAVHDLLRTRGRGGEMAHRFSLVAKGAELSLSLALHREAAAVPRVEHALRWGPARALLMAARTMVAASAALDLLAPRRGRRGRRLRTLSGALALGGTFLLRHGIVLAGRASTRDPHATFEMQRAGRGAAELARREGRAAPRMPTVPGVEPTGKETALHAASDHASHSS